MPIPLEHDGSEPEESRRRQAIIFQDDTFSGPIKEPLDSGTDGLSTAEILFEKTCFDDARPVDQLDEVANFGDQRLLSGLLGPRSIAGNEKPRGTRQADSHEDTPRGSRTIESKDENRRDFHGG